MVQDQFDMGLGDWPTVTTTSASSNDPTHHGEVRRELSYALQMWARQSGLEFTEVAPGGSRSNAADIRVYFHRHFHGDGYPFDGAGSVLAHAFFPGSGRGGDVHFDDDEAWSTQDRAVVSQEATSVFAVALHEFGHSLGLSHSSVEGSLMFPWYAGVPDDYMLPEDDRLAIQHLYGKSTFEADLGEKDETNDIPNPPRDGDVPDDGADENNGEETDSAADGVPDRCATDFDAVAVIRSEMWVFKGNYFWRLDRDGESEGAPAEDPIELSAFWYGLPDDVDRVDAVYERPDHKIVFFVGPHYYVLTGNSQLEAGLYPWLDWDCLHPLKRSTPL